MPIYFLIPKRPSPLRAAVRAAWTFSVLAAWEFAKLSAFEKRWAIGLVAASRFGGVATFEGKWAICLPLVGFVKGKLTDSRRLSPNIFCRRRSTAPAIKMIMALHYIGKVNKKLTQASESGVTLARPAWPPLARQWRCISPIPPGCGGGCCIMPGRPPVRQGQCGQGKTVPSPQGGAFLSLRATAAFSASRSSCRRLGSGRASRRWWRWRSGRLGGRFGSLGGVRLLENSGACDNKNNFIAQGQIVEPAGGMSARRNVTRTGETTGWSPAIVMVELVPATYRGIMPPLKAGTNLPADMTPGGQP